LDQALSGAEALFWLTPPITRPDFRDWVGQTAQRAAQAAARHGIKRVVVLSSIGAQHRHKNGPVGLLYDVEQAFFAAVPDVTVLRAGFFMENLFMNLSTIAQAGAIFGAFPADLKFPMVATADIAHSAAQVLRDRTWTGHRFLGVHGPEDLSQNEAAAILAQALGREVKYVQVTIEQARDGMVAAGLPDFVVSLYSEMNEGTNQGLMNSAEPRSEATTTKTSLTHFAQTALQPALQSS
jgi:uncharacterized protein YbjT (DUF2867 family)